MNMGKSIINFNEKKGFICDMDGVIYHVYCDKNVTKADLDQIAAGVTLDDGEIHAAFLSL